MTRLFDYIDPRDGFRINIPELYNLFLWRGDWFDPYPGHPTRTDLTDPARPLQPESMAEMLKYCAMAWRGGV